MLSQRFDGVYGHTSYHDRAKVICRILSRTGRKRSGSVGMIGEAARRKSVME